jgi:hypothetical protein
MAALIASSARTEQWIFDRRQRELLGDLGVLDRHRLVERLALDPLGDERLTRRSPSRSRRS